MKKNLDKAGIYNVYPSSFYDSDGDGIGDLKGITEKLPYLAELADIVWINPIFVSPFHDGGYDIADYYAVDSRFGSMEDLTQALSGLLSAETEPDEQTVTQRLAEEQGLDYAHVAALSLRPEEEELYTASGTPVAHLTVSEKVLKSKEGIYLAL